jgi:hypothetical protein
MPRKVRLCGSGDDTEAAALARSRPEPAPGYVNELAATMTIGDVATQAVEAVRALNQLTADAGELTGPAEAREVVGRLALMGHQLPQLCEQLARFLVAQREDGEITQGSGGDPDGVLVEVSEALSAAGRAGAGQQIGDGLSGWSDRNSRATAGQMTWPGIRSRGTGRRNPRASWRVGFLKWPWLGPVRVQPRPLPLPVAALGVPGWSPSPMAGQVPGRLGQGCGVSGPGPGCPSGR